MFEIDREHPEYVTGKAARQMYRDLYTGGDQLKRNATAYLVQRHREQPDVYAERLSSVFYENYVGSIIDWYAATVFRREPVISFEGANEGAKKFLVDYVGNFRQAFVNGEFYDFPCFQRTVRDLKQLISNDTKAKPPDKYKVLEDVLDWATNIGYPGYANAAIDEIYQKWILNVMFAKAAQGVLSPEDAVKEAEAECKRIWEKWRERKLM